MKEIDFNNAEFNEVLKWIQNYFEQGANELPVQTSINPGELQNQLPTSAPNQPEPLSEIFSDFKSKILPAITHTNDPRYFAYFPCNNSTWSWLGEILSKTLEVNAMSWYSCPAATELELKVVEWLGQLINLPWKGVLQDTASSATFSALLGAREKKAPINLEGFYEQKPLTVYTSVDAHSSVLKAARMAGIGDKYVRLISVNKDRSMNVQKLNQQIENDIQNGLQPTFACATIGTTSTTAMDDVEAIASICQKHQIWLHVDAAMAGSAALLPEMKWLMKGVEQADSFMFNPHKWLYTNMFCSAFFCKNPDDIKRALTLDPAYLQSNIEEPVENFKDWNVQLGKDFRSLKLWFLLRGVGVQAIQEKLRDDLNNTKWFAEKIKSHPKLQLFAEPQFQTVCFHLSSNEETKFFMEKINQTGQAFLTPTEIDGLFLIRVSFGQRLQTQQHTENLWQLLETHLLS